ncbi:MAG: hypothetical protein ACREV4_05815 [Gammaproteobacteria bacterium]
MTTESKGQMINWKLLTLIAVGTLLSLGHSADHAIRDDLRWPSLEFIAFVIVSLVLYGAIGTALYLYAKGKVGPRFWTIFAFAGLLFGWAAHFSPFTDQPPSYILRAYDYGLAGWVALGVLVALMLVMGVVGVYAAYLWRRGVRAGNFGEKAA